MAEEIKKLLEQHRENLVSKVTERVKQIKKDQQDEQKKLS